MALYTNKRNLIKIYVRNKKYTILKNVYAEISFASPDEFLQHIYKDILYDIFGGVCDIFIDI